MISDWSGAAFEYAFGLERPVIFIDLPRVAIRSKIGLVVSTDRLENIPKQIEELCSNPDSYKRQIRKIRSESVYNVGSSGAAGATYIAKTVEKLRLSCGKDAES